MPGVTVFVTNADDTTQSIRYTKRADPRAAPAVTPRTQLPEQELVPKETSDPPGELAG